MTYNPSAYTMEFDRRYWIFLLTPSGTVVRLLMNYANQREAETGIEFLGFKLVDPPPKRGPTTTLNRANTTPR